MKLLKRFAETVAIPIIDAAVDLAIPDSDPRKPMFKAVWYSIKGSYGFLSSFMPEEAEDFMKQVGEYRDEISTELLNSRELQQALILTFDSLILTRNKKKRRVVKKVFFKGYISAKDKDEFELERLYQTSQNISLEAVNYLEFLKKEILPYYIADVEKKKSEPKFWDGRPQATESVTYFVTVWINEQFDVQNQKVKEKYPQLNSDESLRKKLGGKKVHAEDKYEENVAELTSLGIFKQSGGTYLGKPHFTFTEFGLRYLEYLDQ